MTSLTIKTRSISLPYFIAGGLLVFFCLFVGIFSSVHAESRQPGADEHVITLHDNGTEKGFYTKASTLRQALKDANVRLDENDRTEPSLDEVLVASSYEVNVYRARPVTIRDGAIRTKIITAYRTGKQIAKQANIPLQDQDIVTLAPSKDIIADGSSEIMTIDRATPFTFTLYGTTVTAYTQAKTVRDMLKEKNITLGVNDRVSTALDTEITEGMALRVWREGKQTMTQDEDVDFETEKIQDADQPIGYKKVQTVGVKGKKSVTYEVVIEDGKEVRRTEINSLVTTQPVKQVEIVGTKISLPAGSHEDWMAAAGISSSDYGYVNYIVNREGGWQPCKVYGGSVNCNASATGPYGMLQANPGTKMASAGSDWRTNPITQLRWGTSYAVGRYGSWQAAYEYWIKNGHW